MYSKSAVNRVFDGEASSLVGLDVLPPAVAVIFKKPNEVGAEIVSLIGRVCFRQ
jgi:hypothetical protein